MYGFVRLRILSASLPHVTVAGSSPRGRYVGRMSPSEASARQPHQLPPGRHGLSARIVQSNQRERILDAVADVTSLAGYAEMSVEDIIVTAGVSRRTFYDNFKDKEEAFLAAYDAIVLQLVARVQEAFDAATTFPARVRDCLAAFLQFMAGEPRYAELGIVEVLRRRLKRDPAAERGDASGFAALIRTAGRGAERRRPAAAPDLTAETIIGGVYEVVYSRVLAGRGGEARRPAAGLSPYSMMLRSRPCRRPREAATAALARQAAKPARRGVSCCRGDSARVRAPGSPSPSASRTIVQGGRGHASSTRYPRPSRPGPARTTSSSARHARRGAMWRRAWSRTRGVYQTVPASSRVAPSTAAARTSASWIERHDRAAREVAPCRGRGGSPRGARAAPPRLVGVVEALADRRVGHQLLGREVAGSPMRVVVAAVAAGGRAQVRRRRRAPVLADVLARGEHRALRGVRLRRKRQVDRRLRERELAFGQAHVLDRMRPRRSRRQRLWVGVADVLRGEDDHPADDEPRVLATLEHHGQVVQRCVRVRPARGLDPRRDRVVVAIGLSVVEQRPSL